MLSSSSNSLLSITFTVLQSVGQVPVSGLFSDPGPLFSINSSLCSANFVCSSFGIRVSRFADRPPRGSCSRLLLPDPCSGLGRGPVSALFSDPGPLFSINSSLCSAISRVPRSGFEFRGSQTGRLGTYAPVFFFPTPAPDSGEAQFSVCFRVPVLCFQSTPRFVPQFRVFLVRDSSFAVRRPAASGVMLRPSSSRPLLSTLLSAVYCFRPTAYFFRGWRRK